MFAKSQTRVMLDAEIQSALSKLDGLEPKSEEYTAILEQVSKLHKLRTEERSKRISPDTCLIVAANIFGILWLARYERENVIKAPNAMKFVMKPTR
jgi:hypothetical protein